MKTSKSSTIGEKISKYSIVKPIIYTKYKLGLGTKNLKETIKAKNNKLIFKSVCSDCKKIKSRFCSLKEIETFNKGGSIDIHRKYYPYYLKKS